MKKLMPLLLLGVTAALVWRELPAIKRYFRIESM